MEASLNGDTKQLKTAQDYLDAADREFENADALAATENLRTAMIHALKTVAAKKAGTMTAMTFTR